MKESHWRRLAKVILEMGPERSKYLYSKAEAPVEHLCRGQSGPSIIGVVSLGNLSRVASLHRPWLRNQ